MGASGSGKGPLVAHVALRNGRFVMMINDEPVFPMMYAMTGAAYRNWEQVAQRNVELFADAGFRLYEIDVWFRDIWASDGALDVARAARQARSVLDICPSAALFVRLNVTGPHWWVEQNPDECVGYADGPPAENLNVDACERIRRNSHVSEKWRIEATDKLIEFCRRLSAMPEGDAVMGLHLAGGAWGEWFYWGFPHEPDTGPAMTRCFRTWLREKYRTDAALQTAWNDPNVTFDTATVPGLDERYRTQHGIFRDPQQERKAIDYGR